jgi:predicted alpha/beta-hydrolase family hydrolase
VEIMTSAGPAQAELAGPGTPGAERPRAGAGRAGGPAFLLVLTHGAGGGVSAPDLAAVRATGLRLGGAVALVTQPYRVAGRRAPGSADRQDAAWTELIAALRGRLPAGTPLIQGGRSNGARVACRTARAAAARAVLALAFPLHPPGRPERSRAAELAAAGVPVLVVNGRRDPFGIPAAGGDVEVVVLDGETHALSRRPEAVGAAAGSWLRGLLGLAGGARTVG